MQTPLEWLRRVPRGTLIALGLAALVTLTLVIARAFESDGASGPVTPPRSTAGAAAEAAPASVAASEPSLAPDDDGVQIQPSEVAPSVAGALPGPASVAEAFARAWVTHDVPGEAWRAGLAPHATPAVMAKLADTDPAGVPADRVTGPAQLVLTGARYAVCLVPLDFGFLRVQVTAQPDERWLVDTVGWDRS